MGSVWEGVHITLGNRVAVKFIEAELRIQHLADIQLSDRLPDFR